MLFRRRWGTAVLLAASLGLGTGASALAAPVPSSVPDTLTITQVDGKAVTGGKVPSLTLQVGRVWVTGQSPVGTAVTVTKNNNAQQTCTAKADKTGRWSCYFLVKDFAPSDTTWTTVPLKATATINGKTATASLTVTAKRKPLVTFTGVGGHGVVTGAVQGDVIVDPDNGVVTVTGTARRGASLVLSAAVGGSREIGFVVAGPEGTWTWDVNAAGLDLVVDDTRSVTINVGDSYYTGTNTDEVVTVKMRLLKAPTPPTSPLTVTSAGGVAVSPTGEDGHFVTDAYRQADSSAYITLTGTGVPGGTVFVGGNGTPVDSNGKWSANYAAGRLLTAYQQSNPNDGVAFGVESTIEVTQYDGLIGKDRTISVVVKTQFTGLEGPQIRSLTVGGATSPASQDHSEIVLTPAEVQAGALIDVEGGMYDGYTVTVAMKSDPTINCTGTSHGGVWTCKLPTSGFVTTPAGYVNNRLTITAVRDEDGRVVTGNDLEVYTFETW